MSTFEALSLVVGCLALAVSLVVWTGQRRLQQEYAQLQREANELQKATSELAKRQSELLERQELEPSFRLTWSAIEPALTRLLTDLAEWLEREPIQRITEPSEILPSIPSTVMPEYESLDWRYAPRLSSAIQELVCARASLSTHAVEFNKLKILGSERFWLIERLNRIGFEKETENRYNYFGGEANFRQYVQELCTKCGVEVDQPYTALSQSPRYLELLDALRGKVIEEIESLSRKHRLTLAQVREVSVRLGIAQA